jgi:hypothetical protein
MAMSLATLRRLVQPTFDAETEAPCGTSVAEAREAVSFWRGRLARLPWYRRGARAEAREMARRWQRRLVQAELERRRLGVFSAHVLRAVDWWGPPARGVARSAGRLVALGARRTVVGRLVVLLAGMTALCALLTAILVAIVVTQVL